jgi:hypothetical protein
MKTVYQLFRRDTKKLVGSRVNLGIYNKIPQALTQFVKNDGITLLDVFNKKFRLIIESRILGEFEKFKICFDSEIDSDMLTLKKIVFFEALQVWKSNLGCLIEDPETLGFDPDDIEEWDDVPDALALEFLADDNYEQFINENLVE